MILVDAVKPYKNSTAYLATDLLEIYGTLRILTGKKQRQLKLQRLEKVRIWALEKVRIWALEKVRIWSLEKVRIWAFGLLVN